MSASSSQTSRAGLLVSIVALFAALFPFIASDLSGISMMVVFFIVPLLAAALGLASLILSIISLQRLPQDSSTVKRTVKSRSILSIILSAMAIVLGGALAFTFTWFFYGYKAPRSESTGELRVFYYGEPNQVEIATQSVYLPDSTLMTCGFHHPQGDHKRGSGMVMKTSLSGEKLALTDVPGTLGEIVVSPEGAIVNARTRPYPADNSVHSKELALYKLDANGGVLAERAYPLGFDGGTGALQSARNSGFLLDGTYDWIDEDSTRQTSYVTRFTDDLDTLWMHLFAGEYVGRLRNLAPTQDGGCLLLGMRDKPEGSKTVSDTLKLTRLDAEGNLLWSGVSIAVASISPSRANELPDGSFALLCERKCELDGVEGALYLLSPAGEILWSKGVTSPGYEIATDFIPWVNKGFLVVGWTPRKEAKMRLSNADMRFWDTYVLIEVDENGKVTQRYAGNNCQFAAWGLTRIDDNTAAVTGFGSKGAETIYQRDGAQDIGIMIYRHE